MIPDFPHNIRIRLAWLNFFLLRPDLAKSLPCWLSQFSFSKLRQPTGQRLSNVRTQQKKNSIKPILFLYYEESLVSSNLNSKLLRFHCSHPNVHTPLSNFLVQRGIWWVYFSSLALCSLVLIARFLGQCKIKQFDIFL